MTSDHCVIVNRLCSLTLTRLVLLKPLESDLQSLIISIKMHSVSSVLLYLTLYIVVIIIIILSLGLTLFSSYVHMLLPELYALPHPNFKFHVPTSGLAYALFVYLLPLSGTHCLTAFIYVNL